jgi:hypothetical protein
MTTLRILVVGQNAHRATALLGRLDGWSCDFYFAATCAEAAPLLKERRFHFVLSQFMLSDGFADQFLPFLEGTRTHMFFSHLFENDCFWLHVLEGGRNRWWEPQLVQPHDFLSLVDRFVRRDFAGGHPALPDDSSPPCAHG